MKELGPFQLAGAFPRVFAETFGFPANLSLLEKIDWESDDVEEAATKVQVKYFVPYVASLPEQSHHSAQIV